MRRIAVLVVFAVAVGACGRSERATKGEAKGEERAAGERGVLSADGVVADVKERSVKVRTDDGRTLDFALDDDVKVTLGGGESQAAVITEGAPVRVSYKPEGAQPDLVAIDVEPQAAGARGDAAAGGAGASADPARAGNGASGAR